MRKRIISAAMTLMLCVQSTAYASFIDVDNNAGYAGAVERLSTLNIMNGNGDGSFNPDGYITRAEMAKLAAVIADLDVQASASSLFSDMEEGNWANGYVNTVAANGLILGYPDGTFQPEKNVTYAEAITIVLRLLNYSSKILGNNYPAAYLQKAKDLELTTGMNFYYDDYIDRKAAALLFDKALITDMYNTSSSKKVKLIEKLNYSVSDECIIVATNNESKDLLSDEVVTSIGNYKELNNAVDGYVTQTAKLILNKDKKIVSVLPVKKESNTYIIQNVTGNEISTDKDNVKLESDSAVYFKNRKTTFGSISGQIQTGTKMTVYYSANGAYDYAVLTEYELAGPVVFNESGDISKLGVDTEGLKVIRDGKGSNLNSLQKYDVLYYDKNAKILYSYCDKVSGIYEEAYPNKSNVTSIKLSGVNYTLETQDAVKSLGEAQKAYKIDDYITALLGKDGKIAAVVNTDKESMVLNYGVLLSCSDRIENGTKNYYATFLSATGIKQEFKVSMDYDEHRGEVAEYHYEAGFMMPFFVTENKISGIVDVQNRKIGDYWLTKDCKIVDLSYAPGRMYEYGDTNETKEDIDKDDQDDYPDASAKVIEMSEITAPSLTQDEVVNAQLDDSGNVAFLVLNDITMGRYKYGVVTNADKYSTSATYKIDFGTTSGTYSIDKSPKPDDSDVVMASIQGNQLQEIRKMDEVKTSGNFEAIDKQKIKIGSVYYSLAKDAVIFHKDGHEYFDKDDIFDVVSIDDMDDRKVSTIHIYTDKPFDRGGRVRVIVFTEGAK